MSAPRVMAIDPGDVHVGMATFAADKWTSDEYACTWTNEHAPLDALTLVTDWLRGGGEYLVIEEFRLYPWQAENQMWSQFQTSQLIGALKASYLQHRGEGQYLVMQPASIKKPTAAQLRKRKIPSKAKLARVGKHCQDAELHGWYWIFNGILTGVAGLHEPEEVWNA